MSLFLDTNTHTHTCGLSTYLCTHTMCPALLLLDLGLNVFLCCVLSSVRNHCHPFIAQHSIAQHTQARCYPLNLLRFFRSPPMYPCCRGSFPQDSSLPLGYIGWKEKLKIVLCTHFIPFCSRSQIYFNPKCNFGRLGTLKSFIRCVDDTVYSWQKKNGSIEKEKKSLK